MKSIHWLVTSTVVLVLLAAGTVVAVVWRDRILPGITIGDVEVGGLTRGAAVELINQRAKQLWERGVILQTSGGQYTVNLQEAGVILNVDQAVDEAFALGHEGAWYERLTSTIWVPITHHEVAVGYDLNEDRLAASLDDAAMVLGTPRRDVRLHVEGTTVELMTDTRSGQTLDHVMVNKEIRETLRNVRTEPISVSLIEDIPRATEGSGRIAQQQAQRILARELVLEAAERRFVVPRTTIGTWIENTYTGEQLTPGISRLAVSQYVTGIAQQVNQSPVPASFQIVDGQIRDFRPPKDGRALEEDQTVQEIIAQLEARRDTAAPPADQAVSLAVKVVHPPIGNISSLDGITQLIGQATTPFTGSPANRISNIRNGVKFLSGIVVQPGEEFSTLRALGTIDNTTGYLPELVIKGTTTTPEFGGGLCQVSTTLFRAVLAAGLPVVERQNHSYRVSYYEKDGSGVFIGPGLDATIYEGSPDFRFRNDTTHPVLIIGGVQGDKVTFALYGTSDGRTASVAGPRLLTETAPGEPIYAETDTLAPGVIKQIEWPHPGGSATATYTITYPDGHTDSQEFKSYYRRWPARFLVGAQPAPTPL